jgi:glycine betaine/choline ABC-type transport system substrate-binding protein
MTRTPTLLAVLAAAVLTLTAAAPAGAQAPPAPPRLAAPADCLTNPGCGVALRSAYGIDPAPVFAPLTSSGGGIAALDAGTADVAIAFSSDPGLSRPDIVTLADDRRAISGDDRIVPIATAKALGRAGRFADDVRRRLDAAGAVLTTLQLRALNQQLADGERPLTIARRFVDQNGLARGFVKERRAAPQLAIGHQDFPENLLLARIYAETLARAGYRTKVVSVRGFRGEALQAAARGRIGLYPDYAASLLRFLKPGASATKDVARNLTPALRARRLVALRPAPGVDTNRLVTTTSAARAYGLTKVSDLAKWWPAAAR